MGVDLLACLANDSYRMALPIVVVTTIGVIDEDNDGLAFDLQCDVSSLA